MYSINQSTSAAPMPLKVNGYLYPNKQTEISVAIAAFGYDPNEKRPENRVKVLTNLSPEGETHLPCKELGEDNTLTLALCINKLIDDVAGNNKSQLKIAEATYVPAGINPDTGEEGNSNKLILTYAIPIQVRPDTDKEKWLPITTALALCNKQKDKEAIEEAIKRLRVDFSREPIPFLMLPQEFTLSEMQALYENILNTTFDRRNFRNKALSLGILNRVETHKNGVEILYSFNEQGYKLRKSMTSSLRILDVDTA